MKQPLTLAAMVAAMSCTAEMNSVEQWDKDVAATVREINIAGGTFRKTIKKGEAKTKDPFWIKFAPKEFHDLMDAPSAKIDRLLEEGFKRELGADAPRHFTRDRVYVWGGPTPEWGGSTNKDTAVKGAKWFGCESVLYAYGPVNEEMVAIHNNCRNLICFLGQNCRAPGAQDCSDIEEAERISRLSLKYPNLVGAVIDDMVANVGKKYTVEEYAKIYAALKKHNRKLLLYSVVYTHELDLEKAKSVAKYIDRPCLWVWKKYDLVNLDLHIEKTRALFPGKPITLGLYLFDYGLTCLPMPVPAVRFQLEKSRQYLRAGKLDSIVIMADREIEKAPEAALETKRFLAAEFAAAAE